MRTRFVSVSPRKVSISPRSEAMIQSVLNEKRLYVSYLSHFKPSLYYTTKMLFWQAEKSALH